MVEPRIQYAKTQDGVSVAYWTLGRGAPLVEIAPAGWSHAQLEFQIPEFRGWYERLTQKRMLVRYDTRGCGLSDRDVARYSLDIFLLDLDAVVNRLGLESFALMGTNYSGPMAIAYAATHPERVSRLVLFDSFAGRIERLEQLEAAMALIDRDWELFTETVAHAGMGWEAGEQAHLMATYMRQCVAPEVYQAMLAAAREFDVDDLIPQVKCPTLVVHNRQARFPEPHVARELASRIPDARLAFMEHSWFLGGDVESTAGLVEEFLDEGQEAEQSSQQSETGALRTVLFTDIEESTALTQRLGDAKARDVLRTHERIVRDALCSHGGSEVKTMGDGFMASFSSATKALECAIAMQRAFAEHNEEAEQSIKVRVGLNAGEPIAEEEDLFGTAVIVAARIAAKAEGGEILAANVVRELAAGKGFLFSDRGDAALRGFEDPVRLFEVRWREGG